MCSSSIYLYLKVHPCKSNLNPFTPELILSILSPRQHHATGATRTAPRKNRITLNLAPFSRSKYIILLLYTVLCALSFSAAPPSRLFTFTWNSSFEGRECRLETCFKYERRQIVGARRLKCLILHLENGKMIQKEDKRDFLRIPNLRKLTENYCEIPPRLLVA